MKKYFVLLIIIFVYSSLSASEIVDLGGEIRIPLPENWQVSSDSGQFPFQIINQAQTAELLIYKSIIAKDGTIKNKSELKSSVDVIIEDIVYSLPEAKLLSSTGKIDENRAIFSLEFVSSDTTTTGQIFHRLNGLLYGRPNGEQILFTLWGKTNSAAKDILHNEILFMQDNFSYYGESNISFMDEEKTIDWKLFFIVLFILVVVLIVFKKYKASNNIQYSDDSHFWRCSCGRQNHNSRDTCKRCGQKNEIRETL